MSNISVKWSETKYIPSNLEMNQIKTFSKDPKMLREHIKKCLAEHRNIQLVETVEPQLCEQNSIQSPSCSTLMPGQYMKRKQKRNIDDVLQCDIDDDGRQYHYTAQYNSDAQQDSYVYSDTDEEILTPVPIQRKVPATLNDSLLETTVRKTIVPKTVASKTAITKTDTSKKPRKTSKKCKNLDEQQKWDEQLVNHVMQNPILYNYHLESNTSAGLKAETWREICDGLNNEFPYTQITIQDAKSRWASIRNGFLKRRKNNSQSSGAGTKELEIGNLDELMLGLLDVYELDYEETVTNVPDDLDIPILPKSRKTNQKNVSDGIEATTKEFLSTINEIKDSFFGRAENSENKKKRKR